MLQRPTEKTQKAENLWLLRDLGTMWPMAQTRGVCLRSFHPSGRRKAASTTVRLARNHTGFSGRALRTVRSMLVLGFSALSFPPVILKPSVRFCCYSVALATFKSGKSLCGVGKGKQTLLILMSASWSQYWSKVLELQKVATREVIDGLWWNGVHQSGIVPRRGGGMTDLETDMRQPSPPSSSQVC